MSEQQMGATNGRSPAQDPFNEEDFGTFMKSMVDETKAYLGAQRDYYVLLAADRTAKVAGATVSYVVLAVLAGTVLVFLSIAGALGLGQLMGNTALGFLLMGGFYLLVLLVLIFLWRGGMRERFTLDLLNTMHDGPK
ncbi:MAG: hypothetical protein JST66_08440 [Bacteroidetes bacterium]|nr:hypothetical protein [Bacteroidota bacterium]